MDRAFLKAGNLPTLIAAFLYFDCSFMVWVLLGPLGIAISHTLGLNASQKGLLVATPVLAGAFFRVVLGACVDVLGARHTAIIAQIAVILGLVMTWLIAPSSYVAMFPVAIILGIAGASFAVALPLVSGWYPPQYQGTALGIAGAGNSGTALAALVAPGLAVRIGWINVLGLATLPLILVLLVFLVLAKEPPQRRSAGGVRAWIPLLRSRDVWVLMGMYAVSFGGFVGLASFLTIYFNDQYGLKPAIAGLCTAIVVFAGSFVRPLGGALADRMGGTLALSILFGVVCLIYLSIGIGLPSFFFVFVTFFVGMMTLGLANGAVFQLVPTWFPRSVGILTGLVGMSGGLGGFCLPVLLGSVRHATGGYGVAFLLFGFLSFLGMVASLKSRERYGKTRVATRQGAS